MRRSLIHRFAILSAGLATALWAPALVAQSTDAQAFDSGSLKRLYDRSRPAGEARIIRAKPIGGTASTSSKHARIVRPIEHDVNRIQAIDARHIVKKRHVSPAVRDPYLSHGSSVSLSHVGHIGVRSIDFGHHGHKSIDHRPHVLAYPGSLRTTSGYGYYPLGVYNHPTVFGRSHHDRPVSLRTASGYGYYPLGVYNHPTVLEQPRFPTHHPHRVNHGRHHGHHGHHKPPVIIHRSSGFGRHERAHTGAAPSRTVTPVPRGAIRAPSGK